MTHMVCTSGYISKGNEITILKRYLLRHAHCRIMCNSQDLETTQVSVKGWIHIMEYYATMNNKRLLLHLTTEMNLKIY